MSFLFSNNAIGTLAGPITSAAAALTLNAGQAAAFPAPTSPDVFYATLTDAATQSLIEIVKVTAVSGNVFAIVRAQDGTSALSWLAGDFVSHRVVALELRLLNAVVPAGGILLWSGSIATVPQGWNLCDGTNGTPNLTDRFVVGAGLTYAVGATGGGGTITLTSDQMPAHTHVATVTDPGHNHTYQGVWSTAGGKAAGTIWTDVGGNTGTSVTGITVANASTGLGAAITPPLPPYYALAYIMKL